MKNRTIKFLSVVTVLIFTLSAPLCTFAKSGNGNGNGQHKAVKQQEKEKKPGKAGSNSITDKQLKDIEKKLADIEKGVTVITSSIDAFIKKNTPPAPTPTPTPTPATPTLLNTKSDTNNLARTATGITALFTADHFANALSVMTNGIKTGENADSWAGTVKQEDYWGLLFGGNYGFNSVVYTTGNMLPDGGWFASGLKVQVRQNGSWADVTGVTATPAYPFSNLAGTNVSYTFNFSDTWGDGIRITGVPGGTAAFTTIGEFEVFYKGEAGSPGIEVPYNATGFINGTLGKLKALSNRLAAVDKQLRSMEKKTDMSSNDKYKALVSKSSAIKTSISNQNKRLQGLKKVK